MDARTRRAITQRTGARVSFEDGDGPEVGTVVGHYDDDSVYIDLDSGDKSVRVWVSALTLVKDES